MGLFMVKDVIRCQLCGRKLTSVKSIKRGYGLACYYKYILNKITRRLF